MVNYFFSTGLVIVSLVATVQMAAAQAPFVGGSPDNCPDKVCKPVVVPKMVVERKYDDVCEEFCRPKCSLFSFFTGTCGTCADGKCGTVQTRKYLVIHFRKHEECATKCVVETATPCVVAPATTIAAPLPTPLPSPQPK